MQLSWKKAAVLATAIAATVSFTTEAQARGCIKGAIAGGVAGHLVHHGKVGAVAGCAIGHHHAKTKHNLKLKRAYR